MPDVCVFASFYKFVMTLKLTEYLFTLNDLLMSIHYRNSISKNRFDK